MANISWTSSSINSFFHTSLGNPSSAFSGIYNSLNDAALIKSGSYHRLMDSYYKTMKSSDETASDTKTKVSNNVLDELLTSEKAKTTAATYDNNGSKTQTATSTTIDQTI